jgi:ABC-type bacteriocin/lantibiotic exporter with double-glycine peptidase domain
MWKGSMMIRRTILMISICLCMCSPVAAADAVPSADERDADSRSRAQNAMFRLDTMCGPNCVWQLARVFGKDCTPKDIAEFAGTNTVSGTTIKGLVEACKKIGIPAEPVRTNLKSLAMDSRVAILLLETSDIMHYVILDSIGEGEVCLLDADKFRNLSFKELKSMWDGYAILIGNHKDHQLDRSRWYLGTGLQVSGLLILFVAAIYIVRFTYIHQTKRQ